jgi:hypothetical protein
MLIRRKAKGKSRILGDELCEKVEMVVEKGCFPWYLLLKNICIFSFYRKEKEGSHRVIIISEKVLVL